MEKAVSERLDNENGAQMIRAAKHSVKGVVLSKKDADLVGDKHNELEKVQVGFWVALCKMNCASKCFKRQSATSWVRGKAVQRIEHFVDVKTLLDNALNFKLLMYRLMNKQ